MCECGGARRCYGTARPLAFSGCFASPLLLVGVIEDTAKIMAPFGFRRYLEWDNNTIMSDPGDSSSPPHPDSILRLLSAVHRFSIVSIFVSVCICLKNNHFNAISTVEILSHFLVMLYILLFIHVVLIAIH